MNERTNEKWREALSDLPDEEAIADLRAILLRGLRYSLSGRSVAEADLEDFVQDGLIKILEELESFRGEARFTTWAQKVVVRIALTELRRRRWRDVSIEDIMTSGERGDATPTAFVDTTQEPGQTATIQVMMATVQRIIAEELTQRQREAMMAVMVGGMPLQEVADRLGTNRNALYKLLHDARQRLQKRMMNEGLSPHEMLAMFDTT